MRVLANSCCLLVALCVTETLIAPGPAKAQLDGFACPLTGTPEIRQADAIAGSGGRFDSTRGEGHIHGALDLNASLGQPAFASRAGRAAVAQLAWGAMGNTVVLDHGSGAYTVYGHLDTLAVKEGATVTTGQKIGTVGYTGNASALKEAKLPPHLHFALIQAGKAGLADENQPLRKMRQWGDYWQTLGAELTGAVNPGLFMGAAGCWKGSTTVGAPGEK